MERDFLGINGKDSGVVVKEEARGGKPHSAGSTMQWPFSNRISSLQQFMAHKAAQGGRPKTIGFKQLSASGYQSEADHKTSFSHLPQKSVGLHRQGIDQSAIHSNRYHNSDSLGAFKHLADELRAYPVVSQISSQAYGTSNGHNLAATSLKQQPFAGGISASDSPAEETKIGTFTPRNIPNPSAKTAQLTIFYAGAVNVYDDIPLDTARAIMSMASIGANTTSNAVNKVSEANDFSIKVAGDEGVSTHQYQTQTPPNCITSPCSGLSSPISVTLHTGPHSGSEPSAADGVVGSKAIGTSAPAGQNEPPKSIATTLVPAATTPILPRAVPQARKASLARFLEKRKERVSNAVPYPCSKKTAEGTNRLEDDNICSKTSSLDIDIPNNQEQSWNFSDAKKLERREYPNTALEI